MWIKNNIKENIFYGSTPVIFENAKRLRNKPTISEAAFWDLLKKHFPGYRFKRQHPIWKYIADFYCHKFKLVIEIDGNIHLSEDVKDNDKERDEFMQSLGLTIVRFTNDEVCKNSKIVVERMKGIIENLMNHSS